jgi:hypothetical protein
MPRAFPFVSVRSVVHVFVRAIVVCFVVSL